MTCSIFAGCSFTQGTGLANESKDKDLWVNIVHSTLFNDTKLLNISKGGFSNLDILHSAIDAILSIECQFLFVQWTELLRYKVNPSVEIYPTSINLLGSRQRLSVDIHPNITYSKNYIDNIKNRFFDLHHPHYEIVKAFEYSCLLQKLCERFGISVFFINGILPWDKNYFLHICDPNRLPSDTTLYTQQQLNAATRNNEEYFLLYDKVHHDYKILETIRHNWLNLDSGFRTCFYLDRALDNRHPGITSNQQFAQHLIENIQRLNSNDKL